jgi:membrane protein involved in colicin uptake
VPATCRRVREEQEAAAARARAAAAAQQEEEEEEDEEEEEYEDDFAAASPGGSVPSAASGTGESDTPRAGTGGRRESGGWVTVVVTGSAGLNWGMKGEYCQGEGL